MAINKKYTKKDLQNLNVEELQRLKSQLPKSPISKPTYRNGDIDLILQGIENFVHVGYGYGIIPPINAECNTDLQLQSGIDNDAGINNRNTLQQAIDNASPYDVICISSPNGDSYAIQGSILLNKSYITLRGNVGEVSLWFYEYNDNYINNIGPSDGIIIGHEEGQWPVSETKDVIDIDQNGTVTIDQGLFFPYVAGDYLRFEVEIGTNFITYYDMQHYADLYSIEDTTNWNPGWKEFAIRQITSIGETGSSGGTFSVDLPFRYPISLDIFDTIRVSKVSPRKNIGLENLILSNAIYYDDAWNKGDSYENVAFSSFDLNLTPNDSRDLDPCLMDCGYTEQEIIEKMMLASQFEQGNYTNIHEFCVWVDDLVGSGCLSDCPGECEDSGDECIGVDCGPGEICESPLYSFTEAQGVCLMFGIFGFESNDKHLIKMNGCVNCFVSDIRSGTIGNNFYDGIGYSEPGSSIGTSRCPPQFIDNDGDVTNYLLTDLFDKLDYKASVNESLSECQTHSDCPHYDEVDSGWGYFCHSGWDGNEYGPRYCQQYSGSPNEVAEYPMGIGDGDCDDVDDHCADGLVCHNDLNNCGQDFYDNVGNNGGADCCTPGEFYCDETILTSFDNIMNGLDLPHNRMNVTNDIRHILSNGIKVQNSKNVTIQNTIMKLPENRGNERNGILFNIDKSNEILIRDCEGYRGRRNFVVGGWGTSGIVFSKIHSEGGWGFGINVKDLLNQVGVISTNIFESHLFYYNSTAPLTSWGSLQEFGDRWDMGQVENPTIREASGLIHSRKNSEGDIQFESPGELYQWDTTAEHILWTHNDHVGEVEGGVGILYAINAHGAKNVGKFYPTVGGELIYIDTWENDWEDLAIGPPPDAQQPGGCVEHYNIHCTTWPEEEEQCDYYCECGGGGGLDMTGEINYMVTWCDWSGGPYDHTLYNCIEDGNVLEHCSPGGCDGFCDNCEEVLGGDCEENWHFSLGGWQTGAAGCNCWCKEDCQMVTYPHYNTMDCFQSGGCAGPGGNNPVGCDTSCKAFCSNHYGITFTSPTAGQGKCRVRLNGEINDDGTVTPNFYSDYWGFQHPVENCEDDDDNTPCQSTGRRIYWEYDTWRGDYENTCEQYANIRNQYCHQMFTADCTATCQEVWPNIEISNGEDTLCPQECHQPNGDLWPNYDDIVAGNVESNCPNCNSNDQSGCESYLIDTPDGWTSVRYDWCWEFVSEEMDCEWDDIECDMEEEGDCPWDTGIQTVVDECKLTATGQTCEDFGFNECNDGNCAIGDCTNTGMGWFGVPSNLSECNCKCCGEEELGNELNYLPGHWELQDQQDVLYIGDIGDNDKLRDMKHIFRCPEPNVESPGIGDVTEIYEDNIECDVLSFKYQNPDCDSLSHSHLYPVVDSCSDSQYIKIDAETLMVDPSSKKIYIISKGEPKHTVWELENPVGSGEHLLYAHYVGTIKDLWANPWTNVNQITGGDISELGTEIIIKTYGAVFVINRYKNQSIGEALHYNEPTNVNYIPEQMGEGIALDSSGSSFKSKGYFTLSEETSVGDILGINTGVLDVDSDFWSRYANLELMSLFFGYNGFSATTKAMSNSILVTDSDILDGWFSVNREGLFGGRGHSTTNTIFWNVRGNPNPDTENPWKDMAVPGMSALASFQPSSHNTSTSYENGGLIVDTENMNVYTESEDGQFTDYYDYSTIMLGSFFDVAEYDVEEDQYGVVTDIYTGQSFPGGNYVNNTVWFITNLIESVMKGTFDYLGQSTGMRGWLGGAVGKLPECCIDEETGSAHSGFGCPKQDEEHLPCIGICDGREGIIFAAENMGYQPECYFASGISESGVGGHCLSLTDLTFGVPEVDITMNENKDITVNIIVEDTTVMMNGYVWKCGPNWNLSGGGGVGELTYSNTFIAQYQGEGNNKVLIGYLPQETDYTITTSVNDIGYWFDLDMFSSTGLLSWLWDFIFDRIINGIIWFGELAQDLAGDFTGTSLEDLIESNVNPYMGMALHNNLTNGFAVLLNEFKFLSLIRFGTLQTINFTLGTDGSHYQTGNNDTVESDGSIPNLYQHQLTHYEGDDMDIYEPPLLGDINDDGIINVFDVVIMIECILGGRECPPQADINQDGVLNIVDVIAIINMILQRSSGSVGDVKELDKQLQRLLDTNIPTESEKQQLEKQLNKLYKISTIKPTKPRKQKRPYK